MHRLSQEIKKNIQLLRSQGNTYSEINKLLELKLAKSTLSDICKEVQLPENYQKKIQEMNKLGLIRGRQIALALNKAKRKQFFDDINKKNIEIADQIFDPKSAKIALSMLCLGEASKYSVARSFSLGSSDPRIIILFLSLLTFCFKYHSEKIRCTVQCRADQDIEMLEQYWREITGIPKKQFYKTRIDPRTIGKPTKKSNYKGVLKIDYFDIKVQLELESLAEVIYNKLLNRARSLPG